MSSVPMVLMLSVSHGCVPCTSFGHIVANGVCCSSRVMVLMPGSVVRLSGLQYQYVLFVLRLKIASVVGVLQTIRAMLEADGNPYKLYFYMR